MTAPTVPPPDPESVRRTSIPAVRSVRLQADRGLYRARETQSHRENQHALCLCDSVARWRPAFIALLLVLSFPAISGADVGLLRTVQALDEVRGYCLDIAGAGATLRLDDRLQVHTCKYGGPLDDQRFERAANGVIKTTMYDRCLAAAALEPGAGLLLRPCGAAPAQRWSMASGRISPESRPDLCVSVAGDKGQPAGTPVLISPVYRRRDVSLERCADARESAQSFRWSLHDERALSTAEIARNGMPPDVAKQLASLDRSAAPLRKRTSLRSAATRARSGRDQGHQDLAYGTHERQNWTSIQRRCAARSAPCRSSWCFTVEDWSAGAARIPPLWRTTSRA